MKSLETSFNQVAIATNSTRSSATMSVGRRQQRGAAPSSWLDSPKCTKKGGGVVIPDANLLWTTY